MTTAFTMAWVGAVGAIVGASALQAFHPHTPPAPPPAYLISNAQSITDTAMLLQYGAVVGKTIAAFGGHAIVRGTTAVTLDASPPPKGTFVVVQFPSMQALQDWWHSPAYAAIRSLRERSTVGRLFALEGASAP